MRLQSRHRIIDAAVNCRAVEAKVSNVDLRTLPVTRLVNQKVLEFFTHQRSLPPIRLQLHHHLNDMTQNVYPGYSGVVHSHPQKWQSKLNWGILVIHLGDVLPYPLPILFECVTGSRLQNQWGDKTMVVGSSMNLFLLSPVKFPLQTSKTQLSKRFWKLSSSSCRLGGSPEGAT